MAFGNHLLDNLPAATTAALTPHLSRTTLTLGQRLIEPGALVATLHFPVTCQLANTIPLQDGASVETSLIGAEGVSGLAPVLADRPCSWAVTVRAPGDAWALPAPILADVAARDRPLMERLLLLTGFYQAQASQFAACNRRHNVVQRLARLLLTAMDLSPGQPLYFTQDDLAVALGNTRSSVNEGGQYLKDRSILRYTRGKISVLDRPALERVVCECYRTLHDHAARDGLLPDQTPR